MVWNINRLIHRSVWLFDLLHTRSMDWLNLSLGEPEKQIPHNIPSHIKYSVKSSSILHSLKTKYKEHTSQEEPRGNLKLN